MSPRPFSELVAYIDRVGRLWCDLRGANPQGTRAAEVPGLQWG